MKDKLIEKILSLSAQLPTGLKDSNSLVKLQHEQGELDEALRLGDKLGAIMEAADCAYYAIKAGYNGLITDQERNRIITSAAQIVDLSDKVLLKCVVAKYLLRAHGNTKDDLTEREAVIQQMNKELMKNEK